MGKFLLISLLLATAIGSSAAQSVTVTYKGEARALTPFERGLAEFNGLRYYEIHLDSSRTLVGLVEVVCRDGETTEKELMSEGRTVTNVSKITFWAQGVSAEEVKLRLSVDGGMSMGPKIVQLPNNQHYILMETYDAGSGNVVTPTESNGESATEEGVDLSVTYPSGAAVPLIAYTTGLVSEIVMGGEKGTLIDYCGLRDKHAHPSRWHDEFGVGSYIYYVARFE